MKKVLISALTLVFSSLTYSASFNCSIDGLNNIEKTICDTPEISELDNQLSDWYTLNKRANSGNLFRFPNQHLKETQKEWLKVRNACIEPECLKVAYENRVMELREAYLNYRKFSSPSYIRKILRQAAKSEYYSENPDLDDLISFILDDDGKGYYVLTSYESYGGNPSGHCGGGAYIGFWYLEVDTTKDRLITKDSAVYGDCGANVASLSYTIESANPVIIKMYVKRENEENPKEYFTYSINYDGETTFQRLLN